MMRWKLWVAKNEHEKPPYHATPFNHGYLVLQQRVETSDNYWQWVDVTVEV